MLERVFEPHISKDIHKFSELTIHNEVIKIMTLNNVTCVEKEKNPICGDTEQMSQNLHLKENYFMSTGLEEMPSKFQSHLVCINCISI